MQIRNIKQLAELAQVSTGTVSRALSGSELISKATRERIQAIAAEHGFHPNAMARNLRTQRTGAVGVLLAPEQDSARRLPDPMVLTLIGLLIDALASRGYDLLLSRAVPDADDWLNRFVASGRVDGVIVIGRPDEAAAVAALASRYRPMVVWGGQEEAAPTHCSVSIDDRRGGYLAAQHLIARGCRRIDFLGDPAVPEIGQRLDGCRAAMTDAGIAEPPRVLALPPSLSPASGDIRDHLASSAAVPQGIVAASDMIAASALRALAEQSLAVPGDVRVVGFDGSPLGEFVEPALTTVTHDLENGAAQLVDTLLRRIAGEDSASVVLEPKLVVRQSA